MRFAIGSISSAATSPPRAANSRSSASLSLKGTTSIRPA